MVEDIVGLLEKTEQIVFSENIIGIIFLVFFCYWTWKILSLKYDQPEKVQCTMCGEELPNGETICPMCGEKN